MKLEAKDLRRLALHLERRPYAPSLDGYELARAFWAIADLIDDKPGPMVHPDMAPDSDAFRPRVHLLEFVRSTLQSSEER